MVTQAVAPASTTEVGLQVAAVRALPTTAVAAVGLVLAWQQGSLRAPDWLPGAVVVALVLAVSLGSGVGVRIAPAGLAGVAGLVGLALWAALSIAWSPSPSGARDEALLATLYAVSFVVPLVTVRSARERRLAVWLVVAGLAVTGIATCITLIHARFPADLYFGGRLDRPISYPNATALLFALGYWPAVATVAHPSARPAVRGAALGAAMLFVELTLAAQSKGALLGLIVSAVVVFAFLPYRLRLLIPTAATCLIAAATFAALTAPYRASTDAALAGSVRHVGKVALIAAAVAAAAGGVYAIVDRRFTIGARTRRAAGGGLIVLLAAGILTGVALFIGREPHPDAFMAHKWAAFKHVDQRATGSTHLLSLGSARYDLWRVALHEFIHHPASGIGARGFYSAYLREGRTAETPLRAHSLYFDTLSEEGLIGALLLAVALVPPLVFLARRRASLSTAAALAAGVVFVVHAGVDWMWTVPPVGMLFFVLVGLGAAGHGAAKPLSRATSRLGGGLAVLVALVAFAPPWVADRYVADAYRTPADAGVDLRWARRLDPLSLDPFFARWRLAPTPSARIAALEDARRLEPDNIAAAYQLGLSQLAAGRRRAARASLLDAHRLAPRDELIAAALNKSR